MATDTSPTRSDEPSKLGKFIQTYHSFLSSFVIGAAGLVATSIWQYRQSEISQRQAESQQKIAATQADNQWRISRAEILAKNLGVLSSSGESTVEQRYGVLLSLTRGSLLDPELAVSYALELGKDNATYMKSVLASTSEKTWPRLAGAFELTCQQRFGVTRDAPICNADRHVERSEALSELLADEVALSRARNQLGPLELLQDERMVQDSPAKLSALFAHYLADAFERRQWHDIERFESTSEGARLVSALVLAPALPNSFVAASEAADVEHFRSTRAEWLHTYLFGKTCAADCKGKLVDVMLTSYAEAEGRFDAALRELFGRPRSEAAMALARLHARLLNCQIDPADGTALRDAVLVPALVDNVKRAGEDKDTLIEEVLGLLALTPDPGFSPEEEPMRTAWTNALALARERIGDIYNKAFTLRREGAQATRKSPPARLRNGMLCTADEVSLADVALDE